jgi:signal transduction histidine kinase
VDIPTLVEPIVEARNRTHPVRAFGARGLVAMVDPLGLEQALGHLVQNAIEASGPNDPVEVRYFESGGDIALEITDRGHGMAAEFVRTRLFQPFVSTKESGYGIGAYEARSLIAAMGGRLEVDSTLGEGTRFTLFLPGAENRIAPFPERMRA